MRLLGGRYANTGIGDIDSNEISGCAVDTRSARLTRDNQTHRTRFSEFDGISHQIRQTLANAHRIEHQTFRNFRAEFEIEFKAF